MNKTTNAVAEQLKRLCAKADEVGTLLPEQLEVIYANKWFKLFVPEKFGGLALSLPEALQYEENFARIDGSVGWTITLCAGANLFIGYINPEFAATIFYDEKVCLGGSGTSSGTAQVLEDGYLINGFWKYATGAPHLTHFTANCTLEKEGKPLVNDEGLPVTRSFIFKKEEVIIHQDWNTMGLKATATNSFEIKGLKVGKERMFIIDEKNSFIDSPIYRYPFLQLAETTLAVNSLGMAEHFLDEVLDLFQKKRNTAVICEEKYEAVLQQIKFAANFLEKSKEQFYAKVDESWQQLINQKQIDADVLERISFLSKGLAKSARELATEIYPLCGIAAAQKGTVLNRIFRNIFTASQHSLLGQ